MVRVEEKIRVYKDGRVMEAKALFDTGSRGSYFSREFAEKIGFKPYLEPKVSRWQLRVNTQSLLGE
jgi:predicted metal-dependent RNase